MSKLKECPFCGAPAETLNYESDGYLIKCSACDGMVETWFLDEEEAVAAWNRRAKKDPDGNEEEMLRIHQEMLDFTNNWVDSQPPQIDYHRLVDWFNTIKAAWPWAVQEDSDE